MKMQARAPEKAEIDSRYVKLVMQDVIRDIFDALVEFITNSDDSYHRLYSKGYIHKDGGPISIEIIRHTKSASEIIVRDRAEGMTLQEMRLKIKGIGKRTSLDTDRGFMGRGAKECAVLGLATFESIKDGIYHKCQFNSNLEFIPYEPSIKANQDICEKLGIRKNNNGTVVTLEIQHKTHIPRFDTLVKDLPFHYALRDIFSKESPTKGLIIEGRRKEPIIYQQPTGELVTDIEFEVPNYQGVRAKLLLWKSTESLDGYGDRFRRNGVLVKDKRAIHECSFLNEEFEKDPLAHHYFGKLECSYINELCREYDKYIGKGEDPPAHNFCLIIDPARKKGLRREHPFTKALFQIPIDNLRGLVNIDREKERDKSAQVANQETKSKLNRLAKAASKYLSEQLEDINELSADDLIDQGSFAKSGMLIYPTYFKIGLEEVRRCAVYVNGNYLEGTQTVTISSENAALNILNETVELVPHKKRENVFIGYFRVRGDFVSTVTITATINENIKTEAVAQVVFSRLEEHEFIDDLEFEHGNYNIREGKRRTLKLYAKYPEVIAQDTGVNISSSDSEGVPIRGKCELIPIIGSNYALGEVVIQGRKLNSKAEISVTVNGHSASTRVKVIKDVDEGNIPIHIDIVDQPFGNFRATWAEHEGKPNHLLISAKHKSVSRYLGPAPDFDGQKKPHFQILVAEIVAESVCRKSLTLEAKQRNWEFRWADLKDDHLIVDSVLAELHRRMRDFSYIAHSIMLELKDIS